jgi:quercetin 2,3-dioxygenase
MEPTAMTQANAISYDGGPAQEVTGPASDLPGAREPYFLDAGQGRRRAVVTQLNTRLIASEESDGKLTVAMLQGAAEENPLPAHQHEREDHLFFILEGAVRVWVGGLHRLLHPGDCAFLPAGLPHSFRLEGAYNKLLSINTPGGFETFFDQVGEPTDNYVAPTVPVMAPPEKWQQAAAEHDWHAVPNYDFGL